jgi:membrane-associated protein
VHHVLLAMPLIPAPQSLLDRFGSYSLWVAIVIVFVECGLFVFFLPGDSLLFTVGLLIAHGTGVGAPIWLACVLLTGSAIAGNAVGFLLGRRLGTAVFRPNARLLKTEHLDRTHAFFDRYGSRAIILARFVPVVRTFITLLAGAARMDMRRYLTFTVIGGVLWGSGVTLLGFWLGRIGFVRTHIELMLVLLVALSLVPIGLEYLRHRRQRSGSAATG